MGSEIKLSFFTVEVLVSLLAIISVLAVVITLSVRYRSWLNQILILHTFGECRQIETSLPIYITTPMEN